MPSRRAFVHSSVAAVAALGLPAVNVLGANEELRIGLIGTGGRCRHLLKSLTKIPNVRIIGLCDVAEANIDLTRPMVDPKAIATRKYPELLARKDIDAVLIATPDHWHVPLTIAAVEAGKDVYVEKPLTHDLSEGQLVIDAVRKSKQIVQVGTQQRSMPHIAKGRELIAANKLGRVFKVAMSWNRNAGRAKKPFPKLDANAVDWQMFLGNAKAQPFDEYRYRQWRWFWDFGGGIFTDLMVHWVDVAHWLLNLESPLEARSTGHFISAEGIWETPDSVETLLKYKNGLHMFFEGTFSNARHGARIEFYGTDATMYIDRGRMELIPEPNRGMGQEMILGDGPKGRDFYEQPDGELLHLTNWVECIRSRKEPNSPIESGVHSAAAAHMANLSMREQKIAKGS